MHCMDAKEGPENVLMKTKLMHSKSLIKAVKRVRVCVCVTLCIVE